MAWEENSRICLHTQLIAILSRIGVLYCLSLDFNWLLINEYKDILFSSIFNQSLRVNMGNTK